MTNKVKYRDRWYVIPDWVRWIATDRNGAVCGYITKPEQLALVPAWGSPDKFQLLTLTIANPFLEKVPDWKKSAEFIGKKIANNPENLWQDFPS